MQDADLFTPEPDTYRFEMLDGIPTLRCYNKRGERTTVHIVIEYAKSPQAYGDIPMDWESVVKFLAWFEEEDEKPF